MTEKRYWNTEEVAAHLGITPEKLKLWIREFGIKAHHRNASHQYMFDKDTIRRFELVQSFTKIITDENPASRTPRAKSLFHQVSGQ